MSFAQQLPAAQPKIPTNNIKTNIIAINSNNENQPQTQSPLQSMVSITASLPTITVGPEKPTTMSMKPNVTMKMDSNSNSNQNANNTNINVNVSVNIVVEHPVLMSSGANNNSNSASKCDFHGSGSGNSGSIGSISIITADGFKRGLNSEWNVFFDSFRFGQPYEIKERNALTTSMEDIYMDEIDPIVYILPARKLSFYYERCRRLLRMGPSITIVGVGDTTELASVLVTTLERNRMIIISKIETSLIYARQIYYRYSQISPNTLLAHITFVLKRLPQARYITGFHQRKMLELFELFDIKLSGIVSGNTVLSMQLADVFCSTNNQRRAAEKFMACYRQTLHGYRHTFTMPDFIRYCSLLIHPLLKDHQFKKKLQERFSEMQPNVRKIQDRRKPLSMGMPYNLMNMAQSGILVKKSESEYRFRPTLTTTTAADDGRSQYMTTTNVSQDWRLLNSKGY